MNVYEKLTPDIGVLISTDPVAVDAASLDLFSERAGKSLSDCAYDISNRHQTDYAAEIGFGSGTYELIDLSSD